MRGVALAPVLAAWRDAGVEALEWDGAASHRGRVVRAVALPQVVQPPGSPALNPAERVFEEVRRAVEGRRYATLADKQAAVETFLTALAAAPDRVRSLAAPHWLRLALREQAVCELMITPR